MIKCGIYNMGWRRWEDSVALGALAEEAGHKVQFFTDQMNAYLFRAEGQALFPNERLAPGPLGDIPNAGTMYFPENGDMGIIDPTVLMGVLGHTTSKIELFLGAIDAVRHGPSKLAQTFLSLSHATQGRAFFALGGSEIKQLTAYGYSRIGSAKKLEEAIQIIRLLFEAHGRPIYFEGEHWSIKGGAIEMEPYGGAYPRIVLAPGVSMDIMGRYSDGMLTNTKRHPGGVSAFARDVATMKEAARKVGRDPGKLTVTACPQVLMHEDAKELHRLASAPKLKYQTMLTAKERGEQWREFGFEHPLGDEWGYARKQRPETQDPDLLREAIAKVPTEAVIQLGFHCGTPEEVADQLRPYGEAGLEYAGIVDYSTWVDQSPEMARAASRNLARLIELLQA